MGLLIASWCWLESLMKQVVQLSPVPHPILFTQYSYSPPTQTPQTHQTPLNSSPHKPLLSLPNYQITAYYLLTTTTSSGALPTSVASKDTPASPPGEPRKTYAEGSRVGCDHAAGGLTRTRDSSFCSYTSGMASSPGNSIATRAFAWLNARWIE